MSYADVKQYYKIFEEAHLEEAEDLEDIKLECEKGNITEEKAQMLIDQFEQDDYMYQFFTRIMLYWSLPRRSKKRQQFLSKEENKKMFSKLIDFDEEEIRVENEDILKNFRQMCKEAKEESND